MLMLLVGTVGGVGTTTLAATCLKQGAPAIGLDLADGMLATRIERPVVALESIVFSRRPVLETLETLVARRPVLLWTPGCAIDLPRVQRCIAALQQRLPVIVDGGLTPPGILWELATVALAVSRRDDPVAAWHEQRLRQAHPGLKVVTGDLQQAGNALVAQYLPRPATRTVRLWPQRSGG